MQRKKKQIKIASAVIVIVLLAIVIGMVIKHFTPSKEVMELTEYYPVPENEVMVVLQDHAQELNGLYIEEEAYINIETVVESFNKRFFWDANEKVLLYTTPTEVIKTELESKDYYINKSKASEKYTITKMVDDKVYVAMDYVKKYSNVEYKLVKNPNRIVIQYQWGEDFLYAKVKKATQLRVEPTIKSDILVQFVAGDRLLYVDTDEEIKKGFSKVMTTEGVTGYVKTAHLKESYYETLDNDYQEVAYTHITKDTKINLVWHQTTNATANNNVLNLLNNTKGVTVISPTWFSIVSNEGDISSIASEQYMERAHAAGVEVWALCDDFNKEVNMEELLAYSSRREKLANELIAMAIKYNFEGLNIDFENITETSGKSYIQFIRELSVKCRNNGIVLSIDSYVPKDFTAFYDREEQGVVADYVVVMGYDEHYGGSEVSGSVSSIGFIQEATEKILEMVPANQVIMALPFYTRLWQETTVDGVATVTSEAYGMTNAQNVLQENGAVAQWDELTCQYYAEFQKDDSTYKIWLEEETSLEEKLKVVSEADLAGAAFWKLGLERVDVWNTIIKYVK